MVVGLSLRNQRRDGAQRLVASDVELCSWSKKGPTESWPGVIRKTRSGGESNKQQIYGWFWRMSLIIMHWMWVGVMSYLKPLVFHGFLRCLRHLMGPMFGRPVFPRRYSDRHGCHDGTHVLLNQLSDLLMAIWWNLLISHFKVKQTIAWMVLALGCWRWFVGIMIFPNFA